MQWPFITHAWFQNLSFPCTNSSLQDSERIHLEHISHGFLLGNLFPHWQDPTAFTSEEWEIQIHVRIHSPTAHQELWVVSDSQGSGCWASEALGKHCPPLPHVQCFHLARGEGRWWSSALHLRTCRADLMGPAALVRRTDKESWCWEGSVPLMCLRCGLTASVRPTSLQVWCR